MVRSRSRSFITTERPTSYDEDQFALPNLNSNWVYYKGKKRKIIMNESYQIFSDPIK